MTEYYKERLLQAYKLHEVGGYTYKQIAEMNGYGKAVNDHIRATFNRFAGINAASTDVEQFLQGNYLASAKALEYYIRYVGMRDRQISAHSLATEINVCDIQTLVSRLNGLSITCPDLVHYTNTHGLNCLNIR